MFVAALFAIPLVAGQPGASWEPWTQLHGGPDRSGVVDLGPAPLDVVHTFSLFDPEYHLAAGVHPGLVATPHGLVTLLQHGLDGATDGARCRYVTLTDARAGEVANVDPETCDGTMAVVGYDPASDAILVCDFGVGDDVTLQAVDAVTSSRGGR